ncbi:MAG: GNAT family N-acetyltransferase [Bowdeniella nasicola]|nr:GNAT family N-acetyltransferase [Bowdeniella nasicola]
MHAHADFAVRPARVGDGAAIWQIQQAVLAEEFAAGLPQGLPPVVTRQLGQIDGALTWDDAIGAAHDLGAIMVATRAGRVVGYGTLTPLHTPSDHAGVTIRAEVRIDVRPVDQRQGHGSRLLAALIDTARSQAIQAVVSWSVPGEIARQRFLPACGFAPLGIRRELAVGDHHVEQHAWYTTIPS